MILKEKIHLTHLMTSQMMDKNCILKMFLYILENNVLKQFDLLLFLFSKIIMIIIVVVVVIIIIIIITIAIMMMIMIITKRMRKGCKMNKKDANAGDLKLFAKNDQQLQGLLNIVKQFSDDIWMEFGLDKCAKAIFFRGNLLKAITLDTITIIKDLEPEENYKYLGVTEGDRIQHSSMREKIRKECFRRVRSILRSELIARNRIDAINSLALPVVTYSFTIINWSLTEIKKVDTKIRKLLTMHRMHHPKSDVNRLYFPRKEGSRGIVQLELSLKTSIIGMNTYLSNTNDWMLKFVKKHDENKHMYSITSDANKYLNEINLSTDNISENSTSTEKAKQIKAQAKTKNINELKEGWKDKPLHGKYAIRASDPDVNFSPTHQWLAS